MSESAVNGNTVMNKWQTFVELSLLAAMCCTSRPRRPVENEHTEVVYNNKHVYRVDLRLGKHNLDYGFSGRFCWRITIQFTAEENMCLMHTAGQLQDTLLHPVVVQSQHNEIKR